MFFLSGEKRLKGNSHLLHFLRKTANKKTSSLFFFISVFVAKSAPPCSIDKKEEIGPSTPSPGYQKIGVKACVFLYKQISPALTKDCIWL
jgi:hypothetical protein